MIVVPEARIREMKANGWWGEETLDQLFLKQVAAHASDEAVIDPPNLAEITGATPGRATWSDLAEAVERMIAVLHAQGLRKDAVVVIQLPNIVELTVAYLACLRLGHHRQPGAGAIPRARARRHHRPDGGRRGHHRRPDRRAQARRNAGRPADGPPFPDVGSSSSTTPARRAASTSRP
jgi:hypothetical protein